MVYVKLKVFFLIAKHEEAPTTQRLRVGKSAMAQCAQPAILQQCAAQRYSSGDRQHVFAKALLLQ